MAMVGVRQPPSSLRSHGKVEEAEVAGNPTTWRHKRWSAAYSALAVNGEVHIEKVLAMFGAAGFNGYKSRWIGLVPAMRKEVTSYPRLGATEVYRLFSIYEKKVQEELYIAFSEYTSEDRVSPETVQKLAADFGFVIQRHAAREVLAEAKVKRSTQNGVTFEGFSNFMDILNQRNGFSKSEARMLQEAFYSFDSNESGALEANEVPAVVAWLSFATDIFYVKHAVSDLVDHEGCLGWEEFTNVAQKVWLREQTRCEDVFYKLDEYELGAIGPKEVIALFGRLGVTILPEALLEAVEDCGLDGESFSFCDFWRTLQFLRNQDGFTSAEASEIDDAFNSHDRQDRRALTTRQAERALRWLGYLLVPRDCGKVVWKPDFDGNSGLVLAPEFRRLVRRHFEVTVATTRAIYRELAHHGGVGALHKNKLRTALKRIDRNYLDLYLAWLQNNVSPKWFFQKNAALDFEDFRRLIQGCRDKVCDRVRSNQGYTDIEAAALRICFVQHAEDGASGRVPPSGLIEIFRQVDPRMESSKAARNRMKKALEVQKYANTGLSWLPFLEVMRMHSLLEEEDDELLGQRVRSELGIKHSDCDDFFDSFRKYVREGAEAVGVRQVPLLLGKPGIYLSDEKFAEVHALFGEAHQKHGGAIALSQFIVVAKSVNLEAEDMRTVLPSSAPAGMSLDHMELPQQATGVIDAHGTELGLRRGTVEQRRMTAQMTSGSPVSAGDMNPRQSVGQSSPKSQGSSPSGRGTVTSVPLTIAGQSDEVRAHMSKSQQQMTSGVTRLRQLQALTEPAAAEMAGSLFPERDRPVTCPSGTGGL